VKTDQQTEKKNGTRPLGTRKKGREDRQGFGHGQKTNTALKKKKTAAATKKSEKRGKKNRLREGPWLPRRRTNTYSKPRLREGEGREKNPVKTYPAVHEKE